MARGKWDLDRGLMGQVLSGAFSKDGGQQPNPFREAYKPPPTAAMIAYERDKAHRLEELFFSKFYRG